MTCVKEILPNGRDVVDDEGDVRSRHDYPRDDYADPSEERLEKDCLKSIAGLIRDGHRYAQLSNLGHRNPETVKAGGVKECRSLSTAARIEARRLFFEFYGVPADEKLAGEQEKAEAYYALVGKWRGFRTGLGTPQACSDFINEQ